MPKYSSLEQCPVCKTYERYTKPDRCCKCAIEANRRWQEANKEYRRKYRQAWWQVNKGRVSKQQKGYRKDARQVDDN